MSDEVIVKKWSVKKTLGIIGFVLYWVVQLPAIFKSPEVIISLAPVNAGFVLGFFITKTAGIVIDNMNKNKTTVGV